MNKTTEALKLAEALENDAKEHREVSYGLDCPPERTANWKHALNCEDAARLIREALAEPVKQEPVAHYKDAPHTIYLQTGCDDPEDCECSFNEWGDTTWCADQIHDTDIPYIRADYAAPVSAKREWVDLTDDEIDLIEQQVYCRTTQKGRPLGVYAVELVRAVITAFKEKNT